MDVSKNLNSIVVFGQYKTGTTVAYHTIREALPDYGVHQLFEADRFTPPEDPAANTVLAKIILGVDSDVAYEDFLAFDRAIYIIRDPRDWVISGLLFLCQQIEEIWSCEEATQAIITLLQQKEARPASVSVHDLLTEIAGRAGNTTEGLYDWISRQQDWLCEFETRRDFYTLRYEEFVVGKHTGLESYLALNLADQPPRIPAGHSHAARTRSYGNWKSWFVESDIKLFRPLFDGYLKRHHYGRLWQLKPDPVLNPAHGSQYVRAVIDRRRGLAS